MRWWQCPVLELSLFVPIRPHLREVPTTIQKVDPQTNQKTTKWVKGYYLSLQLKNTGKTIATKVQPLITGKGQYFYDDGGKPQDNWIPVPLSWLLDELESQARGKPTEEKDLVYVQNPPALLVV